MQRANEFIFYFVLFFLKGANEYITLWIDLQTKYPFSVFF